MYHSEHQSRPSACRLLHVTSRVVFAGDAGACAGTLQPLDLRNNSIGSTGCRYIGQGLQRRCTRLFWTVMSLAIARFTDMARVIGLNVLRLDAPRCFGVSLNVARCSHSALRTIARAKAICHHWPTHVGRLLDTESLARCSSAKAHVHPVTLASAWLLRDKRMCWDRTVTFKIKQLEMSATLH